MIARLSATPKYWLTLDDCARLFKAFRNNLAFDEPIPAFETRFPGKLEGILGSIRQTYDGKNLNNTVLEAASAYFNQLVRGHPFQNGNKRMTVLFTHFFLLTHGIDFSLSQEELYYFAVLIAIIGEKGAPSETTKYWCQRIIAKYTEDFK